MGIEFRTIDAMEPVVEYLSRTISGQLRANKQVLWLVTGGSAIGVAVGVSKLLQNKLLENLVVSLTDERFGEVGHRDSNWQQLKEAGFSLSGAQLIPVLIGEDLGETGRTYTENLQVLLDKASYRIGLFGIGPDGHVAGMLPRSPATRSTELTTSFEDNEVSAETSGVKRGVSRITMTSTAIARLDEAVVFAVGEAKWPQLKRLADTIDIATQPAQALKLVPKLTIFTDMKQEDL